MNELDALRIHCEELACRGESAALDPKLALALLAVAKQAAGFLAWTAGSGDPDAGTAHLMLLRQVLAELDVAAGPLGDAPSGE